MSISWTQNGAGQYLVASKEHLLQIMHKGTLFTDAGTPPTDYLTSSYIQTNDIDLSSDSANIELIGDAFDNFFAGEYDGDYFSIDNWVFTGSASDTGLFGYCVGATLKRIRLSGTWVSPGGSSAGFLCGNLKTSVCYDIEGNFSTGTLINASNSSTASMIGRLDSGSVNGLSVRGIVDFQGYAYNGGGVVGYAYNGASLSRCRNVATFPSNITGYRVGGIVGNIDDSTLSKCLNAMTGDIVTTVPFAEMPDACSGGICGYASGTTPISQAVNSMTGNVTSEEMAGGIVGYARSSGVPISWTTLFNYMTGNISGSTDNSGGLVGYLYANWGGSIDKCIVAMFGTVEQSVRGREIFDPEMPLTIEVYVDNSFGFTSTGTDYQSSTPPVDITIVYDAVFTDLPYFVLAGTDTDGNVYSWDFVYGNIGGKYTEYSHLSLHTAEVSAPYYTDFTLAENNNVVYLTYANVATSSVYHDPSITVASTAATNVSQIIASKNDFLSSDGSTYDITEAGAGVLSTINEIFATGDTVIIKVNNSETKTAFVNRGDQVNVADVGAVLLPFNTAVTDAQQVTLILGDNSTVDTSLDQASGQLSVDAVMYNTGDHLILDGKKITIVDI